MAAKAGNIIIIIIIIIIINLLSEHLYSALSLKTHNLQNYDI